MENKHEKHTHNQTGGCSHRRVHFRAIHHFVQFFVNIEKIDKTDLYTLLCRCFVVIGKIDKTDPYSLFAVNACKCSAVNNLQNYNFKSYWNVEQEVSCTKVHCKRDVSGVCIVSQM